MVENKVWIVPPLFVPRSISTTPSTFWETLHWKQKVRANHVRTTCSFSMVEKPLSTNDFSSFRFLSVQALGKTASGVELL